jgi:hypothetical protein
VPRHTIVVDFDNTIAPNGPNYTLLEPYPGAITSLRRLKKEGLRVTIHSGRTSRYAQKKSGKSKESLVKEIHDYLKKYKIPYDSIWLPDKPMAIAYIDDKAVEFKGNWQQSLDKVLGRIKTEKEKKK